MRGVDPGWGSIRSLRSRDPVKADGARLVRIADLGPDQVIEVQTAAHGILAVGLVDGVPFATGHLCRHQGAKLGRGAARDGCFDCPWHRARYDVRSGAMVRGPQGKLFGLPPYSAAVKLWTNGPARLRTFPVRLVAGWIELDEL